MDIPVAVSNEYESQNSNENFSSFTILDLNRNNKEEVNEKKIYHVVNESPSLGDIIAWIPMVDKFQKQKNCKVNIYTPYMELFKSTYLNLNFYYYNQQPKDVENIIRIGTYDFIKGKRWSEYNLQEVAAKILDVEYEPIKCKIATLDKPKNNFSKKYVCIATQSTAQFKYWNNLEGWTKTIDYLKSLGYDVVCIDRYPVFGVDGSMNCIPQNCINKTGDFSLMDRINDIIHCDFFIGLSSGLSWLAWSLGKPVILISGISLPHIDFPTPYRVTNTRDNLCHGCAAEPDFIFDKNNWLFCPKNKNFECTREISFEMVKEKIDLLMVRENLNYDFYGINAIPSFKDGAKIEIYDTKYSKYLLHLYAYREGKWILFNEFIDLLPLHWARGGSTKREKWRWKIFAFDQDDLKLVYQYTYDETDKNIEFILDSESSIYDKEYVKKALAFEKENKCQVFIKSKFHKKLKKEFPDFERIFATEDDLTLIDIYASYKIKRHEIENRRYNYQYTYKLWMASEEGVPEINRYHRENWLEYRQEEVFDDIINYE
jgi:autotransporter strand-loop-strand O-heptosyltransferase